MKQQLYLWIFCLLAPSLLLGQGIVNRGNKTLSSTEKEAFFINFSNSGTFLQNGTLYINGNYTDNGQTSFEGNTGTSHWIGTVRQVIDGSGSTGFYNMEFNNASHTTLSKDVSVFGKTTFVNGIIYGDAPNGGTFIYEKDATYTGVSDARHIDGRVRKVGNTSFRFPVGDEGFYRYAEITAPSKPSDAFTAQYFKADATQKYGTAKEADVTTVNTAEYWVIERTEGTSSPKVTLSWDITKTSANIPSDLSNLVIVRWNGSKWVNEGQASHTGDASAGAITSEVKGYGVFTFASLCAVATPSVEVVEASCTNSASVTITNYDSSATYSFTGSLTNDGAVVKGFDLGKSYTIIVTKGGCSSSANFALAHFDEGSCEDNPCDIAVPQLEIVSQPNCTNKFGVLQITNYDSNVRYVFTPNNVTVDNEGKVLNAAPNTVYYVTASDMSNFCHTPAASVLVKGLPTDCEEIPACDYDKPALSKVYQPTCEQKFGKLHVDNYIAELTYEVSPATASIDNSGNIIANASGEYVLRATNNAGCSYTVAFEVLKIPTEKDCNPTNDCGLAKPEIEIVEATCTTSASAVIKNYDENLTYMFTGGLSNDGAVLKGLLLGQTFTVVASNDKCTSEATKFTLAPVPDDCSSKETCDELWDNMLIFQLISPNGDGKNDVWDLGQLWNYSRNCEKGEVRNVVRIFNRYGALVYEKENYMLDEERFDGENHGSKGFGDDVLPAGTYFYMIEADGRVAKTGYLYVTALE